MKHNQYNGQFMCMSAVNGSLKNVPIAVALVPAETKENYTWFFNHIKRQHESIVTKLNGARVVHHSDRDKGLLPAISSCFPEAQSMSCFKHIVANIAASRTVKGLGADVGMLWKVQGAISSNDYEMRLNELKQRHEDAAKYLEHIEGGHSVWALHPSVENNIGLFGKCTPNVIESEI